MAHGPVRTEQPTSGEEQQVELDDRTARLRPLVENTSEQEQEAAKRFRLFVESVKDYAIFMLDARGNVASWNVGAERIKGYKEEEIVGRHFSTFYPREDVDAGKCEYELEVAAREGRFEEEGWRVRRDGSTFWANVVITAVRDDQGTLLGFAKVTRDLTVRREAEQERVRRARAEEGERRTEEFLAILGHELRNPLAPMVAAVQLLQARRGVGCEHEIAILDRQLKHMVRLLDDVLDISRTLRDSVPLSVHSTEIRQLLENAVDVASPLIRRKGHRLSMDVQEGSLAVDVDAERMTQVFVNLLNNAAKYTEDGGEIRVRAFGDEQEVRVVVEDTGIGISADFIDHLFELFTQAKESSGRQLGGLGVGLAVAKRIVNLHGGEILVHSEGLGHGSRFSIRLPRFRAHSAPFDAASQQPFAGGQRKARRILIVDDNQDSNELLQDLFTELGHEAAVAANGQDALRLAPEFGPDVVLLDIGLPGMNGFDVVRRLREMPECKDIPIIAVSGYARNADVAKALDAGFSGHLAKPLDLGRLEKLLQSSSVSPSR